MVSREINFDGIIGPTHNYAGLSYGNIASSSNANKVSNPRSAALQGLSKMRRLVELGVLQGIIPPHERPHIPSLRALGYRGRDEVVLEAAWSDNQKTVRALSSASSMWAANSATVSPSIDCRNGRVNITPANLVSMPHRSFETAFTTKILEYIFSDDRFFQVHACMPSNFLFSDEGAANHGRLCRRHGEKAVELFVYGRSGFEPNIDILKYPARQTLESSEAIARQHTLERRFTIFARQSPIAINSGTFHNDVVCVTNENLILMHEHAFDDIAALRDEVNLCTEPLGCTPEFFVIPELELSLKDAVESYFFNSQVVTLPDDTMAVIFPTETEKNSAANNAAQSLVNNSKSISQIHFLNVRQSMSNGGGPACLRLRVLLNEKEINAVNPNFLVDFELLTALEAWVEKHYRDRLHPNDLGDPSLLQEARNALEELTTILKMGSFYDFQRT